MVVQLVGLAICGTGTAGLICFLLIAAGGGAVGLTAGMGKDHTGAASAAGAAAVVVGLVSAFIGSGFIGVALLLVGLVVVNFGGKQLLAGIRS